MGWTRKPFLASSISMAPMKAMKAMKAVKSLSKGAIAEALAGESGLKKSECTKVMDVLASGDEAGEERWEVCDSGCVHDQDQEEACHQGRQESHVRKGGEGQGEARQDRRQGLCGCCAQGCHLRRAALLRA